MIKNNNNNKFKPWGFWVTLCFSIITVILFYISIFGVFNVIYLIEKNQNPLIDLTDLGKKIKQNLGNLAILLGVAFFVIITPILFFLIKLKKGISVQEYLAFTKKPSTRAFIYWTTGLFVIKSSAFIILHYFDKPIIEEIYIKVFETSSSSLSLFLTIAILIPIYEEIIFRGFLYKSFRESKVGKWGALIISSFFFAIIHYENILGIFFIGIIFGIAREKTDSLYVPISMHILNNGMVCALVYYKVHYG